MSFVRVKDIEKKKTTFFDRLKALVKSEPEDQDPLEEVYLLDFHANRNADGTSFSGVQPHNLATGALTLGNAGTNPNIFNATMYTSNVATITGGSSLGPGDEAIVQGTPDDVVSGLFVRSTDLPLPEKSVTGKLPVKPVQVLSELEIVPDVFSMLGLDSKIAMFEAKKDLLRNKNATGGASWYASRDIESVLERLKARRNYSAHKDFFSLFRNTTDEKIEPFLQEHDFSLKTSDLFLPDFPEDAVSIMAEYKKHTQAVTGGKSPVFYVIANSKDFKDAFGRRDPILLAQAPFGFYWQILGAWDEEMLILHEL